MNAEEIKKYFRESFHQIAPEVLFEKINLDLPLRDQVEIDSLDLYNIIVSLQKKTGVYIPDSKLAELSSLNELIGYILGQVKTV
ncbi:MAG: acyl carrier protein [Bacteriovorax sp.]